MAPKKPKKKLTPYNRHVQKQMKAGKSMKQAAASWSKKSGKPKAASKSSPKKSTSKPKGGNKKMGKSGFNTQKIFKYIRIGALALPAATTVIGPGTPIQKINKLKSDYFGVWSDGSFHLESMAKGWLPFVAATAVTYGVPKLAGIIRGL